MRQSRIGLISDTHMPQRRRTLPPELPDLFRGVDLILHAGDVGELWVLDQLGALAPVVAVHGNDDSVDAQRELPYQQVIAVDGVRILLWHSHFPDRETEMASRRANRISPERSIAQAQRAGAQVAVFGHWHIPFVHHQDGVCVVNPGALASGSMTTRQQIASVAVIDLDGAGGVRVQHLDLADPARPFAPTVAWEAGFAANLAPYQASIVTPEVEQAVAHLRRHLTPAETAALLPAVSPLAHAVWDGHAATITLGQVQTAIAQDATLPAAFKARIQKLLATWPMP